MGRQTSVSLIRIIFTTPHDEWAILRVPALFARVQAGEHLQDDGCVAALHLQMQLIGSWNWSSSDRHSVIRESALLPLKGSTKSRATLGFLHPGGRKNALDGRGLHFDRLEKLCAGHCPWP